MYDGPRAHRTWLFCDVKCAIREAPISHGFLSLCQSEHFGVCGRILEQLDLIERSGDDASFTHDHRPDRHLARFVGPRRLPQGLAHKKTVALQIYDRFVSHSLLRFPRAASHFVHPDDNDNARRKSRRGVPRTTARFALCPSAEFSNASTPPG